MTRKTDAIRHKELRGAILAFLVKVYPESMARNSILATYYEYYRVDDIDDQIAYLKEKGYIEEREVDTPFLAAFQRARYYTLTARGMDLYEGTVSDVGVLVPQEG